MSDKRTKTIFALCFLVAGKYFIEWLRKRYLQTTVLQKRLPDVPVIMGCDIGGTLTKIVFVESLQSEPATGDGKKLLDYIKSSKFYGETGKRDIHLSFECKKLNKRFHFLKFETSRFDNLFHLIKEKELNPAALTYLYATGGGAYKFQQRLGTELKIQVISSGEVGALVRGVNLILQSYPEECYYLSKYKFGEPIERKNMNSQDLSYPYLIVNIGSGVSILKVEGEEKFERVGGTQLGGGTFLGLCRALTECRSFDDALQLAEKGQSSILNLLVKDIYGGECKELNLDGEWVASSFGKLVRMKDDHKSIAQHRTEHKEDYARALLLMITNNIGSLANLYANKVLHVPKIVYVGNFLAQNEISQRCLAYSTQFWSKSSAHALFLKHEGYFGAVGSISSS